MTKVNYIRCRSCTWVTRKWGRGSNPEKAWLRLAQHVSEEHDSEGHLEAEMDLRNGE